MPKFCRAWLSLCLVCSPLFAAEAQRGRSELHWHSITGCPTESEIIRMVEERLGQRLDAPRDQSLFFDGRLTRNETNEFELLLSTDGQSGKGQRTLANSDCGKLAEAAALVIAIAIDPKRVEQRQPASSRAPDPTKEGGLLLGTRVDSSEAVASGDALTLRQPAPQTQASIPVVGTFRLNGSVQFDRGVSRPQRSSLGIQALIGSGILPRIDLGVAATVGYFVTQSLALRVGAGGLWPQSIDVASSNSGSGSISIGAIFGHASLCVVPWQGSWQSVLCAGADVGALLAEGHHLEKAHGSSAQFALLIADAGYRLYLKPRLGLTAMVSTGIGVLRPEFGIVRNGVAAQVYRPDLEVVRLGVGGFWDVR